MGLDTLEPRATWEIFEKLFCGTYRPSNGERAIREKLLAWVKEKGDSLVSATTDKAGNVLLIRKPTPGCEGKSPILLQGHLDMVYETDREDGFDFESNPIPVRIQDNGEWVDADGTTLGADNGIGVSIALAILLGDEAPDEHGRIELLLTFAEETGLDGAMALTPGELPIQASCLVNIDSEEAGTIIVGSAGGGEVKLVKRFRQLDVDCSEEYLFFNLEVSGLLGGHSGVDIHLPRANAIKLVARLLRRLSDRIPVAIARWHGGTRHNAIPRESGAIIGIPISRLEEARTIIEAEKLSIESEYKKRETALSIRFVQARHGPVIDVEESTKIVKLIEELPHGPLSFVSEMDDLVETSCNLAMINLDATGGLGTLVTSVRSSDDGKLEATRLKIKEIGGRAGWNAELSDTYPGWAPNLDSPFLNFVKDIYEKRLGQAVKLKAIHAGLECGVVGARIPRVRSSMLSIGPTIENAHTPGERVRIKDVSLILGVLKDIIRGLTSDLVKS